MQYRAIACVDCGSRALHTCLKWSKHCSQIAFVSLSHIQDKWPDCVLDQKPLCACSGTEAHRYVQSLSHSSTLIKQLPPQPQSRGCSRESATLVWTGLFLASMDCERALVLFQSYWLCLKHHNYLVPFEYAVIFLKRTSNTGMDKRWQVLWILLSSIRAVHCSFQKHSSWLVSWIVSFFLSFSLTS